MYMLCNHSPNQDIEIYIIPENSLMLVYSPPLSLYLLLVTQASGLWCLVGQDVYRPPVGSALPSSIPADVPPGVVSGTVCGAVYCSAVDGS